MEALLNEAAQALQKKDGQRAMQLVDQILAQDETNCEAWFIAMKTFQLLYPIEQYNATNELTCARYAIRFAPKENKYRMRKQVYQFLMNKICEVLKRDTEVLSDGRSILSYYQRIVYFDATHAPERTAAEDRPVVDAVLGSFPYCKELFDFIPGSFLEKNQQLNALAAEVAHQWQHTYSCLEMRYELYHSTLPREMVEEGLTQYARFLRNVKNREEIIAQPVSFNMVQRLDQVSFLHRTGTNTPVTPAPAEE
jgi:hypothetical protein